MTYHDEKCTLMTEPHPSSLARVLRCDEGKCVACEEFVQMCGDDNIVLKIHVAVAPWQTGRVERSIGVLKGILNKMVIDYGGSVNNKGLCGHACKAMDTQQRYDGFPPSQLMIGYDPEIGGQVTADGVRREIGAAHRLQ